MSATFLLRTLGRLDLSRDRTPVLVGRRKLLCLLAYQARQGGARVSRHRLAALFWPEVDEARARQSLRQALSTLRAAVGTCLLVGDDDLKLARGNLEVDATLFERDLDVGDYASAEARWRGEFLPGEELSAGEELRVWLEAERERLRLRRGWLGAALVEAAESRGAWARALAHAERWKSDLPDDPRALKHVRRLLRLSPPQESSAGAGSGFRMSDPVGRERDFLILTTLWRRVEGGEGGLARIHGDPGSGKTRLLEDFLRWIAARRPGTFILRARGGDESPPPPFGLMAFAPGVAAAPAASLRALAGAFTEFAERFPLLPRGPTDELTEAVPRALVEIAAETPVVIAVDDAHLVDRETAHWIGAIGHRRLGGVLLLLTSPRVGAVISDLQASLTDKACVTIRLAPFDVGHIALHRRAERGLRSCPARNRRPRATHDRQARRAGRWSAAWLRIACSVAIVLGLTLASAAGTRHREPMRSIAVLPVRTSAVLESDELAATTGLALRVAFEQVRGIRLIDREPRLRTSEAARRAGAHLTIDGRIDRTEAGLRLQVLVRDAMHPDWVPAHATVEGSASDLTLLAARAAAELFPREAHGFLADLRTARSRSLPALRRYLDGIRLSERLDFERALHAHADAVRMDPSFVAAWHALARIHMRQGRPDSAAVAYREALSRSQGADPVLLAALKEMRIAMRAPAPGRP